MWTSSKFAALAALLSVTPLVSAFPGRWSVPGYGFALWPLSSNTEHSTNVSGVAFPTNGGYVSNGKLAKPTPMPYLPNGGLGLNETVAIMGNRTTGYGQVGSASEPKNVPWLASFESEGKKQGNGNGPSALNPSGQWNGTYALNSTEATYSPLSDFDYQSLQLALYQEYIELDLFQQGLAQFSAEDFNRSGITPEDVELIEFMAAQELGHVRLISDMLGPKAPKACTYRYPFNSVPEFIEFSQSLTRWGESGVYGFINHLDSRPAAQMLLQSISTEARQQMVFRQLQGLFPMPVFFEPGISQSMAWTLLAPWVVSCPESNEKMVWQNFPALKNAGAANGTASIPPEYPPAITHNRTLSAPGTVVTLTWESPGMPVGPDNKYTTSVHPEIGAPKYAAWISQLNTTYTPLENIQGNTATTVQPDGMVFEGIYDPVVNGTMFLAITDVDLFVTPYNISRLNDHIVAGPSIYQST